MMDKFDSPNFPVQRAPQTSINAMGEAMCAEEAHQRWHETHPGEMCPPEFFNLDTYSVINRGDEMLRFGGGGTIEPGDSFAKGGE